MTDVDLSIRMTADAADAARAADTVGDAYESMGRQVDAAADKAAASTSKIESVAASADNMDTKMAGATASLGALSGGLEAAGFPGAAGALQGVAAATDFLSGAGQGLTLVLESEAVANARAKAAAIAKGAADKAQAAITKGVTAGQWALNAALNANPIGLVVIAVAALVAGLVLAYNKSDTFRAIVDAAMRGAKQAVQTVVDKVGDIVGKVQGAVDKFPALSGAVSVAKTLIVGYFDAITFPIRTLIDWVDKLLDKLSHVKVPHIGNPFGRTAASSTGTVPLTTAAVPVDTTAQPTTLVQITVQGAVDPASTAQQLVELLRRYGVNLGTVVTA